MRNLIPIIFVAATLLAGCRSPATVHKTTTADTQTVPGTNIVANANAPASSNSVAIVKAVETAKTAPTAKIVAITNTMASLKIVASSHTIESNNILVIIKTNVIDNPGAVVATPAPADSITPAQPLSENDWPGDLAAAFIVVLAILAVRRP